MRYYVFIMYVIDTKLGRDPKKNANDKVLRVTEGSKILGHRNIIGNYQRFNRVDTNFKQKRGSIEKLKM